MAKNKRLRVKIIKMLKDLGALTTSEIYANINNPETKYSNRHGTQMQNLVNVLGKESVFIKVQSADDLPFSNMTSITGNTYSVATWDLDYALLATNPDLESPKKKTFAISSN